MQESAESGAVGPKSTSTEAPPVRTAIKALYRKGDIIEVRAWDQEPDPDKKKKYTGRYQYGRALVDVIEIFDSEGLDVYTALNPVALGGKLRLRSLTEGGLGAWEKDIPERRWLLLDFDPVRNHKIATDEQHEAALSAAKAAKAWIESYGLRGIVMASSGNGVHLDVPCRLPNTPESKALVLSFQRAVAGRFGTPAVKVDCLPDANRLVRAYGTVNKKGAETDSLKHRRSGVIEAGDIGTCDPADILARIVEENPLPEQPKPKRAPGGGTGPFTRDLLDERLEAWRQGWEGPEGEEFDYEDAGRLDGFRVWCPGNFPDGWPDGEAHGDVRDSLDDSAIVWVEDGWPRFSCRHAHCGEGADHGKKTWRDLQDYYDPKRRLHRLSDEIAMSAAWELPPSGNASISAGEASAEEVCDEPLGSGPPVAAAGDQAEGKAGCEIASACGEESTPAGRPGPGKLPERKKPYEMPESAMHGWLGKKARELETPLGFAYPAMLTAFAALLNEFPRQVRPTLYTALAGPVHCGKSETIKRALASLEFPDPDIVKWTVPGSDRGLINIFSGKKKDKKGTAIGPATAKTRLLAQDELRNALAKADINGSSLPSTLCSLWSQDEAGAADKTGEHVALVRLNVLGALKADDPDDFAEVFGKQSTSGLYDRFVYGIAAKGWKDSFWEANKEARWPSRPAIPAVCFRMLTEWRDENPAARGRLGEMALRVAYISAAASQEDEIGEECMRAALEFAAWQEAVRSGYKAGLGEGYDAQATNAILNVLEKVDGKWVVWREVAQRKNWYRKFGAAVLSRVRDSLARSGMTVEETQEDEYGRQRRTGRLRLRQEGDDC